MQKPHCYLPQLCSKSGPYFLLLVDLTSSVISRLFFLLSRKPRRSGVSAGPFDWSSAVKYLGARRGEGGSARRRLNYPPLKVRRGFRETAAIINKQRHMRTSRMIPDAPSWIIKVPKVPFAHCILSRQRHAHESEGALWSVCVQRGEKTSGFCFSARRNEISSGFRADSRKGFSISSLTSSPPWINEVPVACVCVCVRVLKPKLKWSFKVTLQQTDFPDSDSNSRVRSLFRHVTSPVFRWLA